MKKLLLLLLMLFSLGLASCLPQTTATPTFTPTTPPLAQAAPTQGLTIPSGSQFLPDSGCTAVTKKPTPGATQETIYPPITAADHAKGPANAKVTIIEYSDFQ